MKYEGDGIHHHDNLVTYINIYFVGLLIRLIPIIPLCEMETVQYTLHLAIF